MISEKMKKESVLYLCNFYEKNEKRLSDKDKQEIFNLARDKHRNNKLLAKEIVDSKLCQLATLRLRQQGKCESIKVSSTIVISAPKANDIIFAMNEILEESNKRGLNKDLAYLCYGGN